MPKVKVKQEIKGDRKKVYSAVKKYLEGKDTLKKLGGSIDWDDKACEAAIEGGNFTGTIQVTDGKPASTVEIMIDLPLLLTPFKGKVEDELKKHLGRVAV